VRTPPAVASILRLRIGAGISVTVLRFTEGWTRLCGFAEIIGSGLLLEHEVQLGPIRLHRPVSLAIAFVQSSRVAQ